jgi:hypothetical protein
MNFILQDAVKQPTEREIFEIENSDIGDDDDDDSSDCTIDNSNNNANCIFYFYGSIIWIFFISR